MKKTSILLLATLMAACTQKEDKKQDFTVHLITVDPGHFHAALVQKTMYPEVDTVVQVYAPEGDDLQQHMDRISAYNKRTDNPTNWKEKIFIGSHFFDEMIKKRQRGCAGRQQRQENQLYKKIG